MRPAGPPGRRLGPPPPHQADAGERAKRAGLELAVAFGHPLAETLDLMGVSGILTQVFSLVPPHRLSPFSQVLMLR